MTAARSAMTIRTTALRAEDGSRVNRSVARRSGVTRRPGRVLSSEVRRSGLGHPGMLTERCCARRPCRPNSGDDARSRRPLCGHEPLVDFYRTQIRILWEWRGGRRRPAQAPGHHPARLDLRADRDRRASCPGVTIGRLVDAVDRGHPDGAVQRARPPGAPGPRRPALAHPDRGPGPRPPGRHVPDHRAAGARRPRRRLPLGADRLVRLRRHQHRADVDPGRRPRRVVLRPPDPDLLAKQATRGIRQARPRDHPDRRARAPDPGGRIRAGLGQHDGQLGPRAEPQALALGGDPAVDDLGQPGRHPARQQRRHPGVPLVRARPPAADGLEQPGRRGGDRPPPVERRGPALEQRRRASAT